VQALAYTQGTDIHVAPGQEKCLPREAWHVAQQMAGRVSPTTNINGMPVNDNAALEHEADVMGEKAVQCKSKTVYAKKSVPLDGKNEQGLKYDGEKEKVVDAFCRKWSALYEKIQKNVNCSKKKMLIGKINSIKFILTEENTTSYSLDKNTVWINKNDVNGDFDQLFQRCLHELGHYVDHVKSGYYVDDYYRNLNNQKAKNPNIVTPDSCIVTIGRELYADMFAFVVRMQKENPKTDNDLKQMIESIDLSGRPQKWIEVLLCNGYPPAEYEKDLIFEYGKLLLQKNPECGYVKFFDGNFNNILIRLTNDMEVHHSELRKGNVLIYLSNWYEGKEDANRPQLSIELYQFKETDVPQKCEHIWRKWKLQKRFALQILIEWYKGKIDSGIARNAIDKIALTEDDFPENCKHFWETWKLENKV
jgi:hypothetical protein